MLYHDFTALSRLPMDLHWQRILHWIWGGSSTLDSWQRRFQRYALISTLCLLDLLGLHYRHNYRLRRLYWQYKPWVYDLFRLRVVWHHHIRNPPVRCHSNCPNRKWLWKLHFRPRLLGSPMVLNPWEIWSFTINSLRTLCTNEGAYLQISSQRLLFDPRIWFL